MVGITAQIGDWSGRHWSGPFIITSRQPKGGANANDIIADLARAPSKWLGHPLGRSVISMPYAFERLRAWLLLPRRRQEGENGARDPLTEHQHRYVTRQHKVEPSPLLLDLQVKCIMEVMVG